MKKTKTYSKLYKIVSFTLVFVFIFTSAISSLVFAENLVEMPDISNYKSDQNYIEDVIEENIYPLEPIEIPPTFIFDNEGKINNDSKKVNNQLTIKSNFNTFIPQRQVVAPYNYDFEQNEAVNLNTGVLEYEVIDETLPGKNGLDLVIGRRYDSEDARAYNPVGVSGISSVESNTYSDDIYGLGMGWSFMFSSIEDDKYIHLEDGRTYEIYITDTAGDSNLKDYALVDLRIEKESSYSNGSVSSSYTLYYKDGKKEYFSSNGMLIGIKDRFDNEIKFVNTIENLRNKINIIDSLNRNIVIHTEPNDNFYTTIVSLPEGELSYKIDKLEEENHISALGTFKNQLGHETHYSYNVRNGGFDVYNKETYASNNHYLNLITITYPTNYQAIYTYEPYVRNLGSSGLETAYRIKTREDKLGTEQKNKKTYTYSNDNMSGYPTYSSYLSLPAQFSYSTAVKDETTNIITTSTFDNIHQLKKEESKLNDKLVKINEIQYDLYKLPTQIETRVYNTFNDNFMKTVTVQDNDRFGNVIVFWSPLANGVKDRRYQTNYVYDNSYNLMLSKIYEKDFLSQVLERNTLSNQNKTIGVKEILETNFDGTPEEKTAFSYDSYGNIISIKNYKDDFVNFEQTQYTYNNGAYITEIKSTGIKDSDGILVRGTSGQTAGTIVTKYSEYDSMGRVKKVVDANGNQISFDYNCLGDLIKQTNPDGTTVEYDRNYNSNYINVKDENNRITQYTYTPDGHEYSVNIITNGQSIMMWCKEYDALNRLHRYDDRVTGNYTIYNYDHFSRITSKETRDGSNNLIAKETYDYDEAYGDEKLKRIQKTVNGDENSPSIVTTEYSNNMGQILKTGKWFKGKEYFDTYSYDYVGNKLKERSAYATNLEIPYSARWEYDYAGRIIKSYNADGNYEVMGYDALGRMVTCTDYAGTVTRYIYDGLDRLLEERIPISSDCYQIKNYDYDSVGNMISSRISNNPVGASTAWSITDYDYDVRNRLQYVVVHNDSNIDNVTKYTYDGVGNTKSIQTGMSNKTASDGKVTNYTYDFLDRIKTITDPLNQTESYFYEAKAYGVEYGLLESKTDRNGNRIKYTYDCLGRITRMTVTTPEGEIEQGYYAYTMTGAKKGESNTNVSTTYKYDELGRMIQENECGNIVKNYSYDIGNNCRALNVLNNGNSIHNVRYEYNNMSRLKYVYDNKGLQAIYTYNINGAQEKLKYANGNSEHYNYNLANWLTRLENRNTNNSVISSYDYTYYADGNQKTKTDHTGRVSTYVYDDVGRLKNESEGTGLSISYNYDRFSNRELMKVIGPENYTVSYDYDNNNRLEKDIKIEGDETSITNYYYDCNGNQTSKMTEKLFPAGDNQASVNIDPTGAEFYEYDGLNRLTRAFVDGKEVTYTYRTDGLRSSKTTSEGTTTHVWDGQNIVTDLKNGAVDTRYIRGVNLIKSDNSSNNQKYYLYNGHGDVVQLAGNNGDILWNYDYDAFGNERQIAGQDASLDNNPFRYSGEYFDKETGTIYLRARNYDSKIGRFTTEDSYLGNITDPLSLNLYTYCHNNPLRFFDPTGHYTEKEAKAVRDGLKSKNWLDKIKAVGKAISITSRDRYNNVKNDYINKISDPRAQESAASAFDISMGYLSGEMTAGLVKSTRQVIKGASKAAKADFYVAPSGEVIPSTGYRYMSENAPYLDKLNKTKTIPANSEGTYFSFDKYDVASPEKLQVPHDASIRGSFDTLQIIDDIRIPNGNWGEANYLEPIIKDFPEYGIGGARQVVTKHQIILYEITKLHK